MHKIVNPKQTRLFDPFDNVLTKKTRKRHDRKAYELLDEQCEVYEEKVWVKKKTGGAKYQLP